MTPNCYHPQKQLINCADQTMYLTVRFPSMFFLEIALRLIYTQQLKGEEIENESSQFIMTHFLLNFTSTILVIGKTKLTVKIIQVRAAI